MENHEMAVRTPFRLAFGYQARVGKDTAAEYLQKRDTDLTSTAWNRTVTKSFAKAIYDIMSYAQQRCGFTQEKDRHFLQYIGTQWARAKDPDVWLNVVLREIDALHPQTHVFITDVRFPNEFDALEKRGFTMVNIRRDTSAVMFGNGSVSHESETALIPYTEQGKWHITIHNDGTLAEFYAKLDLHFPKKVQNLSNVALGEDTEQQIRSALKCPLCFRPTEHVNPRLGRCYGCFEPLGMGEDQEDFY